MTKKPEKTVTPTEAKTRAAKGAAQEAIGKLIGDDAEVSKGQAEQAAAKRAARGSDT